MQRIEHSRQPIRLRKKRKYILICARQIFIFSLLVARFLIGSWSVTYRGSNDNSNPEEELKQLERKVIKLVEESAMLADSGDIAAVRAS
jgi:hypothetical protein